MKPNAFVLSHFGHTFTVVDPNSATVAYVTRDIEQNSHGLKTLRFKPKTILDIGAHVGTFSILCSKMFPDAQIWAVEPVKKNFENLNLNLYLNNVKNVIPFNFAVGESRGEISLKGIDSNTGGMSVFNLDNPLTEKVSCVPLDDLLSTLPEIDLMKMDIEGSEYMVMKTCTLLKRVKNLSIEIHKLPGFSFEENKEIVKNFTTFLQSNFGKENLCIANPCSETVSDWGLDSRDV